MVLLFVIVSRSIPACAGPPRRRTPCAPTPRVYPRVCGATTRSYSKTRTICGLSPRVRGHLLEKISGAVDWGSIPACAGPPFGLAKGRPVACGLSPRVRGHPSWRAPSACTSRSIPACAGPPLQKRSSAQHLQVYPRVCGATRATVCQEPGATGPSLRVSLQRATVCRRVQLQA